MKKIFLLYILFSLISCKKPEISNDANVYRIYDRENTHLRDTINENNLIKRITTYTITSNVSISESYRYDYQNRLIEVIESKENSRYITAILEYHDSVIYRSFPCGRLPYSWKFLYYSIFSKKDTIYLNKLGQAVRQSVSGAGISDILFKYDSEGFLSHWLYTKADSNIVQFYYYVSYPWDNYSYVKQYFYTYYDEYENTVFYDDGYLSYFGGNNNIGIYFWGKQNKNLLKTIKDWRNYTVNTFSYQFDEKKRVKVMRVYDGYGTCVKLLVFEY